MEAILIGTAILWVLSAVLVIPLTNLTVARRMVAEGVDTTNFDNLTADQQDRWKGVATRHYMFWDVLVLGIAGLIGGLLGYYFIGISLEAKGWPGMVAFIGASLFASSVGLA